MAKVKGNEQSKLRVFTHHGVSLNDSGSQAVGDCPFCDKEKKFYVSKSRGQYHCKVCGVKGNTYTFLSEMAKLCKDATSEKQFKSFAKDRGIDVNVLKRNGLGYDGALERWLMPVLNSEGNLVNLMIYDESLEKGKTRSTPTCARHLYGVNKLAESGPIYVCEGEWDALALESLLDKAGVTTASVVAVPGAETFKKEWVKHFDKRDVILLYDNDASGQDGKIKVIETLTDKAKSIRSIVWPSTTPEKYDIRDLISDHGLKKTTWKRLQELLQDDSGQPSKPKIKRTSFKSVLKDFKASLHFDKDMEEALLITLATVISNKIPGDPLWIYIVGPPGCGKSMMLQSFMHAQECIFRSKLTATSLVSGMRQDDGSDPSLLAQLDECTLVIKDFTAVKALPLVVQENLYGILRDAYDGNVLVEYGNGVKRNYPKVHFSIVAGITDVVHGDNRAALGERFLKVEVIPSDREYDQEAQIRASLTNAIANRRAEDGLKDSVQAFIWHLSETFDLEKLPAVPPWVVNRIVSLCQIIGSLRASVLRERSDDVSYRPRPEIGTRLANQILKLGRACALVAGKDEIDEDIYQIMQKVAFSTAHGYQSDIVRELVHYPKGLTIEELCQNLQLTTSTVHRRLDDLQELKIVVSQKRKDKRRGRPTNVWKVTDMMRDHWDKAEVNIRRVIR
jgi:5S rRNA maturation endonuclease (ribonuclease M5)